MNLKKKKKNRQHFLTENTHCESFCFLNQLSFYFPSLLKLNWKLLLFDSTHLSLRLRTRVLMRREKMFCYL